MFLQAREEYEQADFREGVAGLNFSLCLLHEKLGDYERALRDINASLAIYRELAELSGDETGIMICYGQLGDVHNLLEQPETGLEYHLRALAMREKKGVPAAIADGLSGVGRSYLALGDLKRALDYFQRSQVIREETSRLLGADTNLKFIGRIYREMGEYDQTMDSLTRGLEISQELNRTAVISEILKMIADLLGEQGRFGEAWKFSEHSDAEFSHGICPNCLTKHHPEVAAELDRVQANIPTPASSD